MRAGVHARIFVHVIVSVHHFVRKKRFIKMHTKVPHVEGAATLWKGFDASE